MTTETIKTEFVETQQTEQKPMYTISRDMAVVETDKDFANPLSHDKKAIELFLKYNRENMERYFDDTDNYGIGFYACGFNGTAQDEFTRDWAENGVEVF